jgi:SAM-dependent methyltransferase
VAAGVSWRRALRRWVSPPRLPAEASPAPVSRIFGLDRGTPIDRRYIEAFIERHAEAVRGDVLEVGGDAYTRRFGARGAAAHRLERGGASSPRVVTGDLESPDTLPAGLFDCFICTQTYNFVFEIGRAIESSHRLLKPGGVLLATAAGLAPISRFDMERWGDFWRLTTASAKRLLGPWFGEDIEVASAGNAFAAASFVQGLAVEDFADPAVLDIVDPDYPVVVTMFARKRAQ